MSHLKPILLGEFQPQLFAERFPGQHVPEVRGGTAVVNLVRAHLEQGLPVDVLTVDPNAVEPCVRLKSDLLNIWIVKRRPSKAVRDGFRQERLLMETVLQESDADVCHAHWTYEYGMAAVKQKIKPFVVTVHDHSFNILRGQGWRYAGLYLLTQYVLRKARGRLTAVSPYVADYAAKVSGQPVPVIPNVLSVDGCSLMVDKVRDGIAPVVSSQLSVDKETLTTQQLGNLSTSPAPATQQLNNIATAPAPPEPPATSNQQPATILTIADSGRVKNMKRALAAFSKVRKKFPNARYTVMGSGLGEGESLHRWASKKGLLDGVEFKGWRPYSEVLSCMKKADILFHPSLEESFGYPVAEALAAGISVVASRQAEGCAWLLGGGKYGVLVDGRTPVAMAEALAGGLSQTETDQTRLKMDGQEHIRALCGGPAVLAYYQAVYLTQRDALC